jgi:hypothetical protein
MAITTTTSTTSATARLRQNKIRRPIGGSPLVIIDAVRMSGHRYTGNEAIFAFLRWSALISATLGKVITELHAGAKDALTPNLVQFD